MHYFTWKLESVSNILWIIVASKLETCINQLLSIWYKICSSLGNDAEVRSVFLKTKAFYKVCNNELISKSCCNGGSGNPIHTLTIFCDWKTAKGCSKWLNHLWDFCVSDVTNNYQFNMKLLLENILNCPGSLC